MASGKEDGHDLMNSGSREVLGRLIQRHVGSEAGFYWYLHNNLDDAKFICVAAVVVVLLVGCVNGFPAEDLVVKLLGQPTFTFRQYAGYVDVDMKAGRSLFYYFVEADKDANRKPLTLWLNGRL